MSLSIGILREFVMSHFKLESRKIISHMLAHDKKCCEIAELLDCDPTAVSKEIKRNRVISKTARTKEKILCKKLDKRPYVCGNCKYKYTTCTMTQMRYDAKIADVLAQRRLHESRRGINLTREEADELAIYIKSKLENKESLYAALFDSPVKIGLSTLYRYISERKINVEKMSLPYAVTYKKRKAKIKEYDYPNNKINRNNRTYVDFLAYKKAHPSELTVQMDFLGSIKTDKKSILVLIIPEISFPFLWNIENKNSRKVVEIFNTLEEKLGLDKLNEIFPSILTDRDPSFSDISGIEFSHISGEQRTNIFFCDAFKSTQKANVENMNKQLRKFFPKKESVDEISDQKIKEINLFIINQPLRSLDGLTPKEAFIKLFGEETLTKLF